MTHRTLRLGAFALSLAGLCAPGLAIADAGTQGEPAQPAGALTAQAQTRQFVVYFPLGEASLDATAQATIASAAQEFQRSGSAKILVRGHTDTSGDATFNQALSESRQQAVTSELIRQGVPADAISGVALGETELAVPTGDGVPEAQNRRVEIDLQPLEPAPEPTPAPTPEPAPPVAAAPEPQPEPQPEPERAERGLLSIGPFYGYNLEDETGHTSHLGGVNLSLDSAVTSWLGVGVEQAGFYHFDTGNDGFGGRTAASVNLLLGGEEVAPYVGGNIGYLYGSGIDDDFFAGPEIGIAAGNFNLKVAYDIPFNRDLDEGVVATTLGFGIRF